MRQNKFRFDSGYLEKSHFATIVLNIVTAIVILLLSLPIFLILPIIIKLHDGGPVFYVGERLGKNKKKFKMYKFRTLVPEAEQVVGAELISTTRLNLVTPVGHFLRESRLDELPQLLNVLKGDMDIIGPRPEREVVYQNDCKKIPWYDKRFKVKPGLIGYSQLFTPHSASRKARALIDNYYVRKKHNISLDISLLFYAFSVLLYKLFNLVFFGCIKIVRKMLRMKSPQENRDYKRVGLPETFMKIRFKDHSENEDKNKTNLKYDLVVSVMDMNEKHILIKSQQAISEEIEKVELYTAYRPFLKYNSQYKSAHFRATVNSESTTESGNFYVFEIHELSELNRLKLHKYFLDKSIL